MTRSVHTLAASSRSGTASVKEFGTHSGSKVSLPFVLYEFGFPSEGPPPLVPSAQFTDPAGEAFMRSEAGTQLRQAERWYSRLVRQFITRSVQLAGSDLLVLGSGSSKEIISLLVRGIATATFVDVSHAALNQLQRNLTDAGVTAMVDVSYVCVDAWEFLSLSEGVAYDVVLATKSLPGILSPAGSGRSVAGFMELVYDVLREGGSLFCDQHMAFSKPDDQGKPLSDVCPPSLIDLATIAGRYAGDVCYSLNDAVDCFDQVATFATRYVEHGVQRWQFFHFRVPQTAARHREARLGSRIPVAPVPFPNPVFSELDQLTEAMFPINARGNKRIPTPGDLSAYPVESTRVKFDGTPGVLVIDGSEALFVSGVSSFAISLPSSVSSAIVLSAELVPVTPASSVLVVTGLMAVDRARSDPLDHASFMTIVPVIDRLASAGLIANTPELVRYLRDDSVLVPRGRNTPLKLPVDGVQVTINGKNGIFFKPADLATVDATPAEATSLIVDAYECAGFTGPPPSVVLPKGGSTVVEFTRTPGTTEWTPLRPRPDKKRSDGLGSVIHTVFSSHAADDLGLTGTVERTLDRVTK